VSRATAVEAMRFVEQKRQRLQENACSDVRFLRPDSQSTLALAAPPAPVTPPGSAGFPGTPPGGGTAPPVPPPVDEPPASTVLP